LFFFLHFPGFGDSYFVVNPRADRGPVRDAGFAGTPRPGAPRGKMLYAERAMYEDFHASDRWTGEDLHCRWKANIVAIATRHADAVDIRFDVAGRPVWIAMPCLAWVEQKKRTGHVITDSLAAQAAGRYLKKAIESGYDNGREMYTMTIEEVLEQVDAVLHEAGHTRNLPWLVDLDDAQPQV
jgi:hypothetical protein